MECRRGSPARIAQSLVAVCCLACAEGKFVKLGDLCRTASGGQGTFEPISVDSREKCQVACLTQEACVAFEFRAENEVCELHTEEVTQAAESDQASECFAKEFVPLLESKGLDIAVMVAGVFVMHVAFVLKTLFDNCSRWRSNQRRKRQKQLSPDVRILFDRRGVVTKDNFTSKQFQQLERIRGLLRTLSGSLAFGNQTLLANHRGICAARDVAERCAPHLPRKLFMSGSVDPSHTSTFEGTEALLNDLMDRRTPQGSVADTLTAFAEELAVLYAAYADEAPWMAAVAVRRALAGGSGLMLPRWGGLPGFQSSPVPRLAVRANALRRERGRRPDRGASMAQLMEPRQAVEGVYARRSRCLSAAVDLREQLGVGSRRLGMATFVLLAALGLVRFVGVVPALALAAVLGVQLILELLSACELQAGKNWLTILGRVSMPVVLALVVAAFLRASGGRPVESNAEIEGRFTFLPVPPQYSLETIASQKLYVGVVYGIMHANLAVLILLPLPISYGVQALLVRAFPRLRVLVPQSAVWWHRLLGYMLVGGLSVTGMIWLAFQGNECYVNRNIQSCEAFEPQLAAGIDVYVLRFHIVWPLMFFFIPLMIWGRYPESWEGALPSRAPGHGRSTSHARAAGGDAGSGVHGFVYRRVLDVVPLMVVLAGCHHVLVEEFNIFFPFWFVNLALLLLQSFFRLRSFVASLTGECCCLRRNDQMAEFFRKSWWEAAYSSHVFAVVTMSFFAVFYRLEVFYPIFLTWGLYFVDRLLFLYRAYAHRAGIVVGEGTSSYVVNCGEGDRAEPSHVRLVLRKPPGFDYKAGQWCQLAMPQCGAYWGSPSLCLPFMQWHAFSLASKPTDDFLEFHIGVHISRGMFDVQQRVSANKAEGESSLRLSRSGKLLDWLCPHRVPYPDQKKEIHGEFTVESAGMYLTLQGEDGSKLKALRPQMQWTGRLWNVVQRMLEASGRAGKSAAAGQAVHIAGPYGALPWTIDAHRAVMLIGAGVGFPSTGAMLRQLLEDNLALPADRQKSVCFVWTASKLDQLLLCFPSLLVDLTRYVHRKNGQLTSGVSDLKRWLHIKIFISNFEPGEFLSLDPGQVLFPESGKMARALDEVREWLLGQEVVVGASGETVDADGTYVAQGSLGASFSGILRRSLFTQRLVERGHSLGISYCGPPELCSLIRSDVANTVFPTKVEFAAEFAA